MIVDDTLIKCDNKPLEHNDTADLASCHLTAIQELVKLPLPPWRPRQGAPRGALPEAPRNSHYLVPRACQGLHHVLDGAPPATALVNCHRQFAFNATTLLSWVI